jgi:uncharacterized protein YodC (DUF2158 family)
LNPQRQTTSCLFVDVHCRWFQFSSEEPVLTEISTVTGANKLIVLGLRRWFGVVDSSCWFVDVHCKWFQFSSEEPVLTEISTVTGANNFLQYPLNMKYFIKVFLFADTLKFLYYLLNMKYIFF